MRIMVFNVAAEKGGALSVLEDFHSRFSADKENTYFFVLSKPKLLNKDNVKTINFPWIKKSWLHRLFFDYFIASRLVKKYKVNRIISLQNILVPKVRLHQSLFVHNALPFSETRFKLIENPVLWVYQNIIGNKITTSIKKANIVLVQSYWLKKKFVNQFGINSNKIEVIKPRISFKVSKYYIRNEFSSKTFFFPASALVFKNHKVIIDAVIKLHDLGINNYKIIFTLVGNENKKISRLKNIVDSNKLPIEFRGKLIKEDVYELYSKSILIFPSYIETVGLPLLEARMHKSPIIVSDCLYAHEVLEDYNDVEYFNPFCPENLFVILREKINN